MGDKKGKKKGGGEEDESTILLNRTYKVSYITLSKKIKTTQILEKM